MSKSFSLNDKKSKVSLIVEQRFTNTSSKPIVIGEVSKKWVELSILNEEKLITLMPVMNNFDEINSFFMNNCWNKIGIYRENHEKSLNDMEELKRFQGSTFDGFSRRKLIEDRDTILELTGKIQELQNEVNCMNDSRVSKDAESVRSGLSHVPSQLAFFPPFPDPGGMPSRSVGMPSRKDGPPNILGHTWYIGKRFCKSNGVFFSTFSARVQSLGLSCIRVKATHQTQLRIRDASQGRQPEIHSTPVREDFQRIMGQTNNDCRFRIATFACWKITFKTEVCTCSQFPTEAMLWIKEVEMVESVDDLKSACSTRGTLTPDFEVLDAKIASALNKIIHNTRFKKKVSLEEQEAHKEGLGGRQIAYLIYEYLRVIGANDSVENYADLLTIALRNGDIQEFDSKWDEILLLMTKIPSDDILEGLYKLRIWESEKLKLSQIEDDGEKKYWAKFTN